MALNEEGLFFEDLPGQIQFYYFCAGQVLHDQLLTNPPGWEQSKGSWL